MAKKLNIVAGRRNRIDAVDIVITVICILIGFVTVYPMWFVIVQSISDPVSVIQGKVPLWPDDFRLDSYKVILSDTDLFRAVGMSIYYCVVSLVLMLITTMLMSFPLTRPNLKGRKYVVLYLLIPMFVSGGSIASFILVAKMMGLYNTTWALLLPGYGLWNIILCRTFLAGIPHDLSEAAYIDGASNFQVLLKIFVPLAKPVLAVISIYTIVGVWNSWMGNMIYQSDKSLHGIQMYLQRILLASQVDLVKLMKEGATKEAIMGAVEAANAAKKLKYAFIVFTTVPIICVYPMFQKHFIKGVMLGSLKG